MSAAAPRVALDHLDEGYEEPCRACGHAPSVYRVRRVGVPAPKTYHFCELHRTDAERRRDELEDTDRAGG